MNWSKRFVVIVSLCLFFFMNPVLSMAETPKWRILWIILPQLNVVRADGTRFNFSLTTEEIDIIRQMAERTSLFIEDAANAAVDIEITTIVSSGIVTHLTEDDNFLYVDKDDMPLDVQQKFEQAEKGNVPYHLNVATYRLNGQNKKINNYWGLSSGSTVQVRFLDIAYHRLSNTNPTPEEVLVHELCHCFEEFYTLNGYSMPEIDNAGYYGYASQYNSQFTSYANFYRDTLAGKVKDLKTGELIGVKADMWQYNPYNLPISDNGDSDEESPVDNDNNEVDNEKDIDEEEMPAENDENANGTEDNSDGTKSEESSGGGCNVNLSTLSLSILLYLIIKLSFDGYPAKY